MDGERMNKQERGKGAGLCFLLSISQCLHCGFCLILSGRPLAAASGAAYGASSLLVLRVGDGIRPRRAGPGHAAPLRVQMLADAPVPSTEAAAPLPASVPMTPVASAQSCFNRPSTPYSLRARPPWGFAISIFGILKPRSYVLAKASSIVKASACTLMRIPRAPFLPAPLRPSLR